MKVQPISNHAQREAGYRQEMRKFVIRECTWMFAVFLLLSLGMAYLFTHSAYQGIPPMEADWRVLGLVMAVALMVLPFNMMKPERPQPSDVAYDQALRRAAGMDDTVSQ